MKTLEAILTDALAGKYVRPLLDDVIGPVVQVRFVIERGGDLSRYVSVRAKAREWRVSIHCPIEILSDDEGRKAMGAVMAATIDKLLKEADWHDLCVPKEIREGMDTVVVQEATIVIGDRQIAASWLSTDRIVLDAGDLDDVLNAALLMYEVAEKGCDE